MMKRTIALLMAAVMLFGLTGCAAQEQAANAPADTAAPQAAQTPAAASSSDGSEKKEETAPDEELAKAKELGIVPDGWLDDLAAPADFALCSEMLKTFIATEDASLVAQYTSIVDETAFPGRDMRRDDGLYLLEAASEALGWNVCNARGLGICVETADSVAMKMFEQLSGDYPYIRDTSRIVALTNDDGSTEELDGKCAAIFLTLRRMDLENRKTFVDYTQTAQMHSTDFHLSEALIREAAIKMAVRLYYSAHGSYNALRTNEPSAEDIALLSAADTQIERIRANMDSLACTGTAYYVSVADGNDASDGLTPETAWQTLDKVNTASLREGDGVYFNRGEIWRGMLKAQPGVTYSAYGSGEKPSIYGSTENANDPAKWSLLEGTDNIWVYTDRVMDCGLLVFNGGESWAKKVYPYYIDGYVSLADNSTPFNVRTELSEDLMFFCEMESVNLDWSDIADLLGQAEPPRGALYLRCDSGNPAEVYESIEFAERRNIIFPAQDAVFNNLCIKYTGAHAIFGWMAYDVSFCEIGWVGGCAQNYTDYGMPVVMGNAVESDGVYDHYSVTDCYIYQCWDAGVSNQDAYLPAIESNITYAGNVIEYCEMPVEIFLIPEGDEPDYNTERMENVVIEDNYFLYTGFGFSGGYFDYAMNSSGYMAHSYDIPASDFVFRNNVFYLSGGALLKTVSRREWLPKMEGNTYVQTEDSIFVVWTDETSELGNTIYRMSNLNAEWVMKNILGDETGTVRVQ